jgi:hypothetical protein
MISDRGCAIVTGRRRRSFLGASLLALPLLLAGAAGSTIAAASGGGTTGAPAGTQPAPAAAEGLFLVVGGKSLRLAPEQIQTEVKGTFKYYRVPVRAVPETRAPVKIREAFGANPLTLSLVRAKDDGLIFSWDSVARNFDEELDFAPKADPAGTDGLQTWPKLAPGLYALVEMRDMGIGTACFVFRVVR